MRERPPELQPVALTPMQTQQVRDIARACGADPDFLLRVLRESRVERHDEHIGISSSLPARTAGEMRALDLGHAILRQAYEGDGTHGVRARPDFSAATFGAAGYEYVRHTHTFGAETTVISEKSTLWLERQAARFGLDMGVLRDAIVAYSTLIEAGGDLAREALRHGTEGFPREAAFAVAFCSNALTRQHHEAGNSENTNTELYIRNVDTNAMLAQFRREAGEGVLASRPRRTA